MAHFLARMSSQTVNTASTTIARTSLMEAIRPLESPRARSAQQLRLAFCALNLAPSLRRAIVAEHHNRSNSCLSSPISSAPRVPQRMKLSASGTPA